MVLERQDQFKERYGFSSASLQSENFLTYQRMRDLGVTLVISFRHVRPYYGLHWAAGPWLAWLTGGREPAEFALWVGRDEHTR